MNVLALDSSTEACSVALMTENKVVETFEVIGRGHAEHLLPMIQNLLADHETVLDQIDLFAYGAGPGSFTGLRIGAAMMQGLALARQRNLVAVSSLAALALPHQGLVLSVVDARMEEVYHGLYRVDDNQYPTLIGEIGVSSPANLSLPEETPILVCGTGWDRYKGDFSQMQSERNIVTGIDSQYPHAADIARLAYYESVHGSETDPAQALPHYIRNNVARKMAGR